MIRQLEQVGDWARLADQLDHCVVVIPEGEFMRGSDNGRWDEVPQQKVFLDPYEIDRYEITNIQYQRFVQAAAVKAPPYWIGAAFPEGQADFPVVGVTWEEAGAYCQWLGKRLPTEAEWEKACRSSDGRVYPWGDAWEAGFGNTGPLAISSNPVDMGPGLWDRLWTILQARPSGANVRGLRPVGSYPAGASPYGVLDLVGNASEWVADWYGFADYSLLPLRNPQTLGPKWNHALRGSSWFDANGDLVWVQDQSRCSARNSSHTPRDARTGFRCARSIP